MASSRTLPTPPSLRDRLLRVLKPGELRPVRSKKTHGYRPDVDGLRAVAVIAVMLFHAGVPGFSGGFVGVDIFFVISGYLIGRIVLTEVAAGTFTFANFYDRRVRRILPPLFLMIGATLVMGWFLLLPGQLEGLGFEAVTAIAFVSNIWFWRQTGYFAPDAKTQPLLHTWSLAIEEQFYLFFPAMIVIAARISARLVVPLVAAVLLLSLGMSAALVLYYPSADFFLLPTRAWELMIGVLLASGAVARPRSRWLANLAALVALPLMLVPIFLFDEAMPFPGWWALVPTAGTGLLIWAGLTGSAVSDLLARRPMVFVGLLSYSLYLWHWPVYVALHHATASATLSPAAIALGFALSFAFSMLSVRLVEGPLRDRARVGAKLLYPALAAAALAIAAGSALLIVSKGAPGRLTPQAQLLAAGAEDFSALGESCRNLDLTSAEAKCRIGAGEGPPSVLLWGDSHAAAMVGAVSDSAAAAGRSGVLVESDGCFPVFGYDQPDMTRVDRAKCLDRGRQMEAWLAGRPGLDTVIVTARWHRHGQDPDAALVAALARTADELRSNGKHMVVLAGLPAPTGNVPWALATAAHAGKPPRPLLRRADAGPFYQALRQLERQGRLRFVNLAEPFCGDGPSCAAQHDGRALFTDDNHISDFAARRLVAPHLRQADLFAR